MRNKAVKAKKKTSKKKRILWRCMLFLLLGVFLFAGYRVCSIVLTNRNEQKALAELAEQAEQMRKNLELEKKIAEGAAKIKQMKEGDSRQESEEPVAAVDENGVLLQYSALYQENNDMVGWISIEGTDINYPVMWTPSDPNYYLHHDFEKAYTSSGIPFVDGGCDPFQPTTNVLIHGHRMSLGNMFYDLSKYEDESFYKSHPYVQFDTLYREGTYQVIAAFYARILDMDEEGFRYYHFYQAEDQAAFDSYISNVKSMCTYDTGVSASYGDELITLSTCSYHVTNGRFVVVAKRISDE